MKHPARFAFLFIFLFLSLFPLQARAEIHVIELFTAKACSFCVSAEQELHMLAQNKSETIIPLACHVDYYNDESDPLQRNFCTERQKKISDAAGESLLYTPRFSVNGQVIEDIAYLENTQPIPLLEITRQEDDPGFIAALSLNEEALAEALADEEILTPVLLGIHKNIPADPRTPGRIFRYVTTTLERLAPWDGKPARLSIRLPDTIDLQGFVLLIENQKGHILAAGVTGL